MGLARHAQSTQKSSQYLCNMSRKKLGMKLIFCIQVGIRVFHKLGLLFLAGVASMPKVPKITSLQYLRNDTIDYLDFWNVHRPLSHANYLLHKSIKRIIFI